MRKLIVFNHVSLDGYFVDGNGSMRWAHGSAKDKDTEWQEFVAENSRGEGTLLFGRVTYELMTSYWPTPLAQQHDALLAERMNKLPKVVFSRTMDKASWNNTKLVQDDLAEEVKRMKQEPGEGMTILGSGTIVSQLAAQGLIDEFHFVVNPTILGKGRTMFEGVSANLSLKLTKARAFGNGNVFVCYAPAV